MLGLEPVDVAEELGVLVGEVVGGEGLLGSGGRSI